MIRTVRQACLLQENALNIQVSDQIEQLDELIHVEGDGTGFFERTHMTQGMRDLITEGIARLAARNDNAVFHLKQAMGGGKTHLLVGFGLLAKHPELRRAYASDVAHIDAFESARVAAFNGRNQPKTFFWGEIACQLGQPDLFVEFWQNGPDAPDEAAWLELFGSDQPTLILLDEMPPYFHYYNTKAAMNGTVADIVTRAFAYMLTAAGKRRNVCVVVSDLDAAYKTGADLINRALQDARKELGRQERSITPVDLAANEIYDILRKRLFARLPSETEIGEIAEAYAERLKEAGKSRAVSRTAESIADEIVHTYPFHPRLKNIIALFKENEEFKQTRGLIELISRLLMSVWNRPQDDVYLIGAQHFDLSRQEVRDKLTEISGMRDVIAKDIWDAQGSAHAQIVDAESQSDTASQVSSLLLLSSLSTAANAVRGLTEEDIIECLLTPMSRPPEYREAFSRLKQCDWYLHATAEGRCYFDKQENLTKMLEGFAIGAPENKVEEIIRRRIEELFSPKQKYAYEQLLVFPELEKAAEALRQCRTLIVLQPSEPVPSQTLDDFARGLIQKNNLLVLTGQKSSMQKLDIAARQFYAAQRVDERLPTTHPQRSELEERRQHYDLDLTSNVLSLLDTLVFYVQRPVQPEPKLVTRALESIRPTNEPFNGEEQIVKSLTKDPIKLYTDVDSNFDTLIDRVLSVLWTEGLTRERWKDILDRAQERPAMYWLPPRGLDTIKQLAVSRGLWEDLHDGYISNQPPKRVAKVQVTPVGLGDDIKRVRLKVQICNAEPNARLEVHYAYGKDVTEHDPLLQGDELEVAEPRVAFRVHDPAGQYETDAPHVWEAKITIRSELLDGRRLRLEAGPGNPEIRYTLDGSEPRNGTLYTEPFELPQDAVIVLVWACLSDVEGREKFTFPAADRPDSVQIDEAKPLKLKAKRRFNVDTRDAVYKLLAFINEKSITLFEVDVNLGQDDEFVSFNTGEKIAVNGEWLEKILELGQKNMEPGCLMHLKFGKASLELGHDVYKLADLLGITLKQEMIQQ